MGRVVGCLGLTHVGGNAPWEVEGRRWCLIRFYTIMMLTRMQYRSFLWLQVEKSLIVPSGFLQSQGPGRQGMMRAAEVGPAPTRNTV